MDGRSRAGSAGRPAAGAASRSDQARGDHRRDRRRRPDRRQVSARIRVRAGPRCGTSGASTIPSSRWRRSARRAGSSTRTASRCRSTSTAFFRIPLPPESAEGQRILDEQWALLNTSMERAKAFGTGKLRIFAFMASGAGATSDKSLRADLRAAGRGGAARQAGRIPAGGGEPGRRDAWPPERKRARC
jgi:hypothetical protein